MQRLLRLPGSWFGRRAACAGGAGGLLGGVCCVAGAVALASGAGALSSLTTWQDRYGPYVIGGSIALMAGWLYLQVRGYGWSRRGLQRAGEVVGRQALMMGVIYGLTLAVTFAAMRLAQDV